MLKYSLFSHLCISNLKLFLYLAVVIQNRGGDAKIFPFVAHVIPKLGSFVGFDPIEIADIHPTHYITVECYIACILVVSVLNVFFVHAFLTEKIEERTLHFLLAGSS